MRDHKEKWRVFGAYLWARKEALLCLLLVLLIGLPVEALHGYALDAFAYAALLICAILLTLSILDFARFAARHKELRRHVELLEQGLPGLPEAADLPEKDFRDLAVRMERELRNVIGSAEQERAEMLSYFTLWMHQVKTPIAALKLLEEENTRALTEIKRVEQYVEMALSYLKLDEVSQDFLAQECPLDALVRQAARSCSVLFIEKKQALELGRLDKTALTDEKWLCFVVEQLLTNAAKYTPEGGHIRVYLEEGPLTLVVEDDGIGIRAEDIPRLGEKGFTGLNGHEDKRSTGLGLYLCRRITERLGHELSFRSQLGRGTQARIRLERGQLDVDREQVTNL